MHARPSAGEIGPPDAEGSSTATSGATQRCGITQACADGCMMGTMDDTAIAVFQALVSCVLEARPSCGGML
jgi:hypothetical protein